MVRIYKNLHDRNGRQAGVRSFARSISIRRTSAAHLFTVRNRVIFFMGTLQRCIAQRKWKLSIRICSSMFPSFGFYFAE